VVFTRPHTLSALRLPNPRVLYGLLLRAVIQTLQDIAGDPKHLGADIGGLAVLHTRANTATISRISMVSCRLGAWRPRGPDGAPGARIFSPR
jgi:hypothetical protein